MFRHTPLLSVQVRLAHLPELVLEEMAPGRPSALSCQFRAVVAAARRLPVLVRPEGLVVVLLDDSAVQRWVVLVSAVKGMTVVLLGFPDSTPAVEAVEVL
jgi:hypothetical protein